VRGTITGAATALGGVFHSLPLHIGNVDRALIVAGVVVAIELLVIAWVRAREPPRGPQFRSCDASR
jgi:hypothetical protein